jgi:hypothetical protein
MYLHRAGADADAVSQAAPSTLLYFLSRELQVAVV